MSYYWAKFRSINGETFRLDTRIYLNGIAEARNEDLCVGAIVGKNPGSAKPSSLSGDLQQIELKGDKLLPTVRNIVTKAYADAGVPTPDRSYVQVLNLFYLCNPILSDAITAVKKIVDPPRCKSESEKFPWIWYVWGGESAALTPHKSGLSQLQATHHFFFDNRTKTVKNVSPTSHDFAKHTQGLRHDFIVPHIGQIIVKGGQC